MNTNAQSSSSIGKAWYLVALLLILIAMEVELFSFSLSLVIRWLITMGLMAVLLMIIGLSVTGRWLGVLIDARSKMSHDRLQSVLWTMLVLSVYVTVAIARIASPRIIDPLSIAIPAELWTAISISTISLFASSLILTAKKHQPVNKEEMERTYRKLGFTEKKNGDKSVWIFAKSGEKTEEGVAKPEEMGSSLRTQRRNLSMSQSRAIAATNNAVQKAWLAMTTHLHLFDISHSPDDECGVMNVGQVVVTTSLKCANVADLFRGDFTGNAAQFDLGKAQMLCFTLMLVLTYGVAIAAKLTTTGDKIDSLPPLAPGMVALLGISHVAYLLNQAISYSRPPTAPLPLSPELEEYSQAGATISRLPGFRWTRTVYEKEFRTKIQKELEEFEHLNSIPEEAKERIRPRVAQSIARILAYDAWDAFFNEFLERGVVPTLILGILLAIASMVSWFPAGGGILHWITLNIAAIVTFIIYFTIVVFLQKTPFNVVYKVLALLILSVLVGYQLTFLQLTGPSQDIRNGVTVGVIASVAWLATLSFESLSVSLLSALIVQLKVRRLPEDQIVATLCYLLARLEGRPDQWSRVEFKSEMIVQLECIGRYLERDLCRTLSSKDADANAWLQKCTHEMAADLRQLKQIVLLPQRGDRERFTQSLANKLVNAAEGNWGLFERAESSVTWSPTIKLLRTLRRILSFSFPLFAIVAVLLIPDPFISEPIKNSLITAAIGWGVVNIVGWLDPNYEKKIEGYTKLSGLFNKP